MRLALMWIMSLGHHHSAILTTRPMLLCIACLIASVQGFWTSSTSPRLHFRAIAVMPGRRVPSPALRADPVAEDRQRQVVKVAETEEERRRRVMALQNEIAEDILEASDAERQALQEKRLRSRAETRRAIYQAYNKVGGETRLNEIGVSTKISKVSRREGAVNEVSNMKRGKSYAERRFQLLFDSLWLSTVGLAVTWYFFRFETALSYALGAGLGFGYIVLLGRTVEGLGKAGPGSGVGQARFALVILLVLLAGKYRDTIQVIPALIGFSAYQVASFLQAFEKDEPQGEDSRTQR